MIAYEQLAALPGAVALAPASVWIATISLAVLAAVIVVRLYRERSVPVKGCREIRGAGSPPDILITGDRSCGPERSGENCGRENRSGCSGEHLP